MTPESAVGSQLSPLTLTDSSLHHSFQCLTHVLTRKDVGCQGAGRWGQHASETVVLLWFIHTNVSLSVNSTY